MINKINFWREIVNFNIYLIESNQSVLSPLLILLHWALIDKLGLCWHLSEWIGVLIVLIKCDLSYHSATVLIIGRDMTHLAHLLILEEILLWPSRPVTHTPHILSHLQDQTRTWSPLENPRSLIHFAFRSFAILILSQHLLLQPLSNQALSTLLTGLLFNLHLTAVKFPYLTTSINLLEIVWLEILELSQDFIISGYLLAILSTLLLDVSNQEGFKFSTHVLLQMAYLSAQL